MGLTKVVCHKIPFAAGTVLIRQSTQLLGAEKEMNRHVQDLFDQVLIEPAHNACSSSVVLVKKRMVAGDSGWTTASSTASTSRTPTPCL